MTQWHNNTKQIVWRDLRVMLELWIIWKCTGSRHNLVMNVLDKMQHCTLDFSYLKRWRELSFNSELYKMSLILLRCPPKLSLTSLFRKWWPSTVQNLKSTEIFPGNITVANTWGKLYFLKNIYPASKRAAISIIEPRHDKTNKMSLHPAKTQISLGIRRVLSESSLCAQWVAKGPNFLHEDSEDSDQAGRMPRLIWVFAGRTVTLLVLSWGDSYFFIVLSG